MPQLADAGPSPRLFTKTLPAGAEMNLVLDFANAQKWAKGWTVVAAHAAAGLVAG